MRRSSLNAMDNFERNTEYDVFSFQQDRLVDGHILAPWESNMYERIPYLEYVKDFA
jgi:hypothetical protein